MNKTELKFTKDIVETLKSIDGYESFRKESDHIQKDLLVYLDLAMQDYERYFIQQRLIDFNGNCLIGEDKYNLVHDFIYDHAKGLYLSTKTSFMQLRMQSGSPYTYGATIDSLFWDFVEAQDDGLRSDDYPPYTSVDFLQEVLIEIANRVWFSRIA